MTVKELNKFLKEKNIDIGELAEGDLDAPELPDLPPEYTELYNQFGKMTVIANERHPLMPDECYIIVNFDKIGEMIGVFGYYSSWDGTDWDDTEFVPVEAEEQTVTTYKKKKKKG